MSQQVNFDLIPSGIEFDHENILSLSTRATETSTAFATKIAKLQEKFTEIRDSYSKESDQAIANTEIANRSITRKVVKDQEAKKVMEKHRALVADSDSERWAMLKALKEYSDEAQHIQGIHKNPTMFLGGFGMAEPKRLHYQNLLAEAGPAELETAARRAIMTDDMFLSAAIATVIDRRPRDRRPFTVASFAERVVGKQWLKLNKIMNGVQLAYETAFAANKEFERGKADPIANISIALSQRAIEESEAKIDAQDEERRRLTVTV